MSIYDELNGMKLDPTEYGEEPLTAAERKKWERRVKGKLRGAGKKKRESGWGAAAAALLIAVAALAYSPAALAKLTWVSGLLENFGSAGGGAQADYSAYKTMVGETAENEYGQLTLNEVILDADRLLISSTFKPVEGFAFDYRTFLLAKVTIDGREDLQLTSGGQSLREEDGRYTVYGEVNLSEVPKRDPLRIKILYDTIDKSGVWNGERKAVARPWTFEIEASARELIADTKTIGIGREMTLRTGEEIRVEKAILSPVSTLVYYRVLNEDEYAEHEKPQMDALRMTNENGNAIPFIEGGSCEGEAYSGKGWHYARYPAIDPVKHRYTLTPFRYFDGGPHAVGDPFPLR
ncbi:DUF4179 domain-containing protein [Saccharibacillus alkalitolerans]|uniref:DUF4179 domain-containing protein n=1 Tax=Saccharibacillus alkalitolerans TaxID=2705290 RepID=A0ABX0FCA8_9BACL|nr:DUF4179 domain-containing protein [Saccharibacillus alkalitolerans]NGZ77193.1 DUF4179 domain-containing protein [Saccharibacillus alkalitolerans]